jgi:hypothetical protein
MPPAKSWEPTANRIVTTRGQNARGQTTRQDLLDLIAKTYDDRARKRRAQATGGDIQAKKGMEPPIIRLDTRRCVDERYDSHAFGKSMRRNRNPKRLVAAKRRTTRRIRLRGAVSSQ